MLFVVKETPHTASLTVLSSFSLSEAFAGDFFHIAEGTFCLIALLVNILFTLIFLSLITSSVMGAFKKPSFTGRTFPLSGTFDETAIHKEFASTISVPSSALPIQPSIAALRISAESFLPFVLVVSSRNDSLNSFQSRGFFE